MKDFRGKKELGQDNFVIFFRSCNFLQRMMNIAFHKSSKTKYSYDQAGN